MLRKRKRERLFNQLALDWLNVVEQIYEDLELADNPPVQQGLKCKEVHYKEQCHNITKDVCNEVPEQHCVDVPEEKCVDTSREHCKDVVNKLYSTMYTDNCRPIS